MTGPDRRQQALILAALILASFGIFAILPGIDLWASGLFFSAETGFWIDGKPLPELIRKAIWNLSYGIILLALFGLIVGRGLRYPVLGVPVRSWGYILLLYALGPGILVDGLLKRFWGRARPADVQPFGGAQVFTPPHQITDQCLRNCSFTAGEMAAAVALSLSLLVILRHRRLWMTPLAYRSAQAGAICLAFVAGWQRIAAGRHFLSDVVFSTLFVALLAVGLSALLDRRQG